MRHRFLMEAIPFALLVSIAGCGGGETEETSQALGAAGSGQAGASGQAGGAGAGAGGSGGAGGQAIDPEELPTFIRAPKTCVYSCPGTSCGENTTPYACQNTAAWASLPHDPSCPSWDGTYPAPAAGKCSASAPSGEALKYAGKDPDKAGVVVLPDGRRLAPAGSEHLFDEPDYQGGMTTGIALVAGTTWAVAVDSGSIDHAVRVVDTAKVGSGDPVLGRVKFPRPETLNSGLVVASSSRVFVPTGNGTVQALTLGKDGSLERDDAKNIALPDSKTSSGSKAPYYASALAVTSDGKHLLVGAVTETRLLVYDIDEAGPSYGQKAAELDLGTSDVFGLYVDPKNPGLAYASIWGGSKVLEINVDDPLAPQIARTFATDKDPEGMAFLDARWAAVANDLGDSIGLLDRASGSVTPVKVETLPGLHGLEPSGLAYDAGTKRLYAVLAGLNAVAAYDVDLTKDPPQITPAGKLPTSWWPSAVVVRPDGAVVVSSMRGHGEGPAKIPTGIDDNNIDQPSRGGVQVVPAPSGAELAAGEASVAQATAVGALPGYPTVSCPDGVMDFPVPAEQGKASPVIKRVVFILRENKTFEGIFGDMEGVNGDAAGTLKPQPDMDAIWGNLRQIARQFTLGDNYYTDAVYSTQGHVWATYGRTSDFNERTWAISSASRPGREVPGGGVIEAGKPVEGSLFDWMGNNGVAYDVLGEIVGAPKSKGDGSKAPQDVFYPGGPFQNIKYPDLEKACYAAGRARVLCNLGQFTYMTLPNDHTVGVSSKNPTPETMCAVNDEATGMIVDALSHSPMWKDTLIVITEDDPSQGSDHVDAHRAPFVLVSPWVKRGYVSKTHLDVASAHKLFAHVFGLPYPNVSVASAGLPLDAFTSTPDYTPYTYKPRQVPAGCGESASPAESKLTDSWDLDEVDEQPGLDAQVVRWMRGQQLEVLPERLEREIDERNRARAAERAPAPLP